MKIQKTLNIISFFDFKLVYFLKLGSQTYLILADIVLLVIRIAFLSKHFKKIRYSIHFVQSMILSGKKSRFIGVAICRSM